MTTLSATALLPAGPLSSDEQATGPVTLELTLGALTEVTAPTEEGAVRLVQLLSGARRIGSGALELRWDAGTLDLTRASAREWAHVRSHVITVANSHVRASPASDCAQAVALLARRPRPEAVTILEDLDAGHLADVRLGTVRGPERRLVALAAAMLSPHPIVIRERWDDSPAVRQVIESRRENRAVLEVSVHH